MFLCRPLFVNIIFCRTVKDLGHVLYVGTEPPLPGYYQFFWEVNVSCSRIQHGDPSEDRTHDLSATAPPWTRIVLPTDDHFLATVSGSHYQVSTTSWCHCMDHIRFDALVAIFNGKLYNMLIDRLGNLCLSSKLLGLK